MANYSGFSHKKWWFSIVMLVYQRVIVISLILADVVALCTSICAYMHVLRCTQVNIYIYTHRHFMPDMRYACALKKHVDGDVSETFREQFILGNSYGDGVRSRITVRLSGSMMFISRSHATLTQDFPLLLHRLFHDVTMFRFFFHFNPDFRIFHRFPQLVGTKIRSFSKQPTKLAGSWSSNWPRARSREVEVPQCPVLTQGLGYVMSSPYHKI